MVIVDSALESRERQGKPIRVGIVGAGYMGRGIASQLLKPALGMRLAALSNRTLSKAEQSLHESGVREYQKPTSVAQLDTAIARGEVSITSNPNLLCDSSQIDLI